jgi:uncharacterized FAD-dependent dehydrogenase
MKLWVQNIKQPITEEDGQLRNRIAALLGVGAGDIRSVRITRRALDARKRSEVHFLLRVLVVMEDAAA